MANISKITLPDGNVYDLKDRTQTGIFYGTCDTAAATEDKEVECTNFTSIDLVPGVMIFVKFDNTNSGAVADLTLNVNGTGAKHIKQVRNNSLYNIPGVGYLLADRTYPFYYDGTYWCLILTYDSNDYNYRLRTRQYGSLTKSITACGRYLLLLSVSDNEVVPVNAVNDSTATSKTLTTQSFDPFRPIFYYNTTTVISANGYFGNGYIYEAYELIDLRYSFNTGTTLTSKKPVFIVCAPQSDGLVKLHSAPISQSLPTTEDGLYYIYLGLAYDTYRIDLELNKPVYQFKNGRVREVVDDARTVDGHSVDVNVPINARFTDTAYEAVKESIGSASLGTAISADDITAWTPNTPTAVTKKTVVTGGSKTAIPNISKKTVVTGGSKTAIPNISKKTVVTSASGATAAYADGVLTLTNGSFGTGDSVTVGTAIEAYTSLTTGDSVTVGTAIEAYTSLTTGDSVTVTPGTAASLSYTAKSIPNVSVTSKSVVTDIIPRDGIDVRHGSFWSQNSSFNENLAAGTPYETLAHKNDSGARIVSELIPIPSFPIFISVASGFQFAVCGFDKDGNYLGRTNGYILEWDSAVGRSIDESNAKQICIFLRRSSGSLSADDVAEAGLTITIQ